MKGAKDLDEIDKAELFHLLIEHRTRIYENIARDALTLLSIQLFVLPVAVSLISFLFRVFERDQQTEPLDTISQLINNTGLFIYGVVAGFAAVLLTVLVYHLARRGASKQSTYLVQWHQPDLLESGTVTDQFRENSEKFDRLFERVHQSTIERYSESIPDNRPAISELPASPSSGLTWLRSTMTVCILSTLASATLILISILESVFPAVGAVFLIVVGVAFIVLSYALPLIPVLSVLEYGLFVTLRALDMITGVIRGAIKSWRN